MANTHVSTVLNQAIKQALDPALAPIATFHAPADLALQWGSALPALTLTRILAELGHPTRRQVRQPGTVSTTQPLNLSLESI